MTLWGEFLHNVGRPIHKCKHYFPAYERHFGRYVNRPVTLMEVGCGDGGSLRMWKRYFGPHARIIGIDIRPECSHFEEDQVMIRIGDQSDISFLKDVVSEFGDIDIVLDDGSHIQQHMIATFSFLYSRISAAGVYVVEDLQTAYWSEYGGGLSQSGSFIELCKSLIDELNADWTRGKLIPTQFTHSTQSIHFYDGMVAFERGRTQTNTALMIPPRATAITT